VAHEVALQDRPPIPPGVPVEIEVLEPSHVDTVFAFEDSSWGLAAYTVSVWSPNGTLIARETAMPSESLRTRTTSFSSTGRFHFDAPRAGTYLMVFDTLDGRGTMMVSVISVKLTPNEVHEVLRAVWYSSALLLFALLTATALRCAFERTRKGGSIDARVNEPGDPHPCPWCGWMNPLSHDFCSRCRARVSAPKHVLTHLGIWIALAAFVAMTAAFVSPLMPEGEFGALAFAVEGVALVPLYCAWRQQSYPFAWAGLSLSAGASACLLTSYGGFYHLLGELHVGWSSAILPTVFTGSLLILTGSVLVVMALRGGSGRQPNGGTP